MKIIEFEILVIRIVFCVFSFIGCVWHVYDISSIYLSYSTTVNVKFDREARVELPAITLCTNTSYVARYDYMRRKFDDVFGNGTADKWLFGHYLRNLTLGQQLKDATISAKQFFRKCSVMKPISMEDKFADDYIGCENVSRIEESIDYNRKCYTVFAQLNGQNNDNYRIDHDVILRDNNFPLYLFYLNNEYLKDLVLFVHSRRQPFLGFIGGQTNGIHLNNTKYVSFTLSYEKTTTNLLPAPYETNCLDYTTIGYKSQSHCIIKCKSDYFRRMFGGWHLDIPYSREFDGRIYYAADGLRTNKTVDKLIANQCSDVCGKKENCFDEFFTTNTIGQWEREVGHNDDLHGIFIYLPSGRNTRYVHSPRLHLIEYVCYTASVISLWFGISMTTLAKLLIVCYNYYRNKRRDAVKLEQDDHDNEFGLDKL